MYQRIFVPIDGSAPANAGLEEAIRLARVSGGTLRVAYVLDELDFTTGFETPSTYFTDVVPMLRRAAGDLLSTGREKAAAAGVAVDTCLIECFGSGVAARIVEAAAAWHADLLVIGTHGRRGVERFALGSDAEAILRKSHVPVLTVKAPAVNAISPAADTAEVAASMKDAVPL
ncbi:MAG: universal stress protein [Caldimonas sp.]